MVKVKQQQSPLPKPLSMSRPPVKKWLQKPARQQSRQVKRIGMARTFEAEFHGRTDEATGVRRGFFAAVDAPPNPAAYTGLRTSTPCGTDAAGDAANDAMDKAGEMATDAAGDSYNSAKQAAEKKVEGVKKDIDG